MSLITKQFQEKISNLRIKVLLVDDQAIVGATVKKMLEGETDIEFNFCQDPTQAIQTAITVEPTVILQDLVMPDIEGLSLVRFYRGHPALKNVPVIVLSSKEEAITKAESFEVGANDYLVKLPDKIELIARIRYHSAGYISLLQRNAAYDALEQSQKELQSELNKAADYVISQLPKELKEGPIETHWRYIPSAQLGGDAFGYHFLDNDHFAMYLLDVCGHGVGSALLSVSAMNVLRSSNLADCDFKDPVSVAHAMNKNFQMQDHNDLYFTLIYGVFNNKTRDLDYICCGHPPGYLIHKDGKGEVVRNENFFIGGLPFFPFEKSKMNLPVGASLYIYSDGVYEIANKDDNSIWAMEDMFAIIQGNIGKEKSEIDILNEYVHDYSGLEILEDDFSMLRLTFN
ncbi:MAG: fused response regulator/phosphatase [bacterium]